MKPCFRCMKIIEEKSNYLTFTEINNEKVITIDYAHKFCWDEFLKSLTNVQEAQKFLGGIDFNSMKEAFSKMGLTKKEEYVIK